MSSNIVRQVTQKLKRADTRLFFNSAISMEVAEKNSERSQFKEGSVKDLTERLELLDYKVQGRFPALDPNAGRYAEVEFSAPENNEQIIGHVEKWNGEGELWVLVPKGSGKSEFKHYRLSPDQNVISRLINLNK